MELVHTYSNANEIKILLSENSANDDIVTFPTPHASCEKILEHLFSEVQFMF